MIGSIWLRAVPYVVVCALVGVCGFWIYHLGVTHESERGASVVAGLKLAQEKTLDEINAANSKALQDAVDSAREQEHKHATDMAALDMKYTKGMNDAKIKSDNDISAVRSGALRVRKQFTCPPSAGSAASAASQTGTGPGLGDAAGIGGLRQEDAAEIIGESDRADSVVMQLQACQAIVAGDRR